MRSEREKVLLFAAMLIFIAGCNDTFGPEIAEGNKVPLSHNKLMLHSSDWREVCSMDIPDKLHTHHIANLRARQTPFLVVFGTPQHCTMCVDQLVRVASLQEKYGNRFAFLHVDGYKDNEVWVEWGIKGEPWTFIVDSKGTVRKVFPGPTDPILMEEVIDGILQEAG